MTVDHVKRRLIQAAVSKHRKISPCAGRETLEDCFTEEDGTVYLWYNTEDQNTHVVSTSPEIPRIAAG